MGCLMRQVGCLVLLALVAAAAWLTRDRWLPIFGRERAPATAVADTLVWHPLTPEGAQRASRSLDSLGRTSSPVYVAIDAADVASHIFLELSRQLPPSAENVEAGVLGDRVYLRASVRPSDFGSADGLGPFASMLGEREQMSFGGYFHVIRPGLAQFRVTELRLRDLAIPSAMIPRLVRQFGRGARPEGVAEDGLPLVIPAYIADVRVAGGRVVLYRNTP
jgi:hypothetical protein